ncbi:hypothetical protein ACFSGI_01600 [Paenibacillus nicotianae]|uniref:Uncharacterized protein n=1 Tax=Paenibacillus nicotianae TaxID=1526551 RepID=A0ABW4UN17_9BACL
MSNYLIACICEGSFEQAIIEILLEHDQLIFSIDQLLEKEVLRCRKAANFQNRYLDKAMNKPIKVYRILDSRNENFKLSKPYAKKVEIINIITAPEIEMLIIHAENKYNEYSRSRMKPSEFVISALKMRSVKTYDFAKNYFSNIDQLLDAIQQYHSKANLPKNELTLKDLLK